MSETKSIIVELSIFLLFSIGLCGVFFNNDIASILKWFCMVIVSLSFTRIYLEDKL